MDERFAERFILAEMALWPCCFGWRIRWTRSHKTLGLTEHRDKVIAFSRPYVRAASDQQVLNTVRHEVAHVLVGPGHGHDEVWMAAARRTGATPEACAAGDTRTGLHWVGYCNCVTAFGPVVRRRASPASATAFCRKCGEPIAWQRRT